MVISPCRGEGQGQDRTREEESALYGTTTARSTGRHHQKPHSRLSCLALGYVQPRITLLQTGPPSFFPPTNLATDSLTQRCAIDVACVTVIEICGNARRVRCFSDELRLRLAEGDRRQRNGLARYCSGLDERCCGLPAADEAAEAGSGSHQRRESTHFKALAR